MRYFRTADGSGGSRLVATDGDESFALGDEAAGLSSFRDLASRAREADRPVDAVARERGTAAEAVAGDRRRPLRPDEVWAAGVTYAISEEARTAESGLPEMYVDVYEAERPEIFFKATPSRTVGPGERIGIRGDADWNVPEPELGVVLHRGDVVGYTVGNDVSSRDIEGRNPLYLPQAKVYDRCCAIGPCVATPETVGDPHDLSLSMTVERDGETVFEGETSTAEMVRTCEELVSYLNRHNAVPETAVLLTGTSIVPPDEFSLAPGDRVDITAETIGTLSNTVTVV